MMERNLVADHMTFEAEASGWQSVVLDRRNDTNKNLKQVRALYSPADACALASAMAALDAELDDTAAVGN